MRVHIGPWMMLLVVAACGGVGPQVAASSGEGSEDGGSEGSEGGATSAMEGGEAGESGEGEESGDGASSGEADEGGDDDGGGTEAHECAPRDPALDELPCNGSDSAESEPNDEVAQANPTCVGRSYGATLSNNADIDVFEFESPPAPYGGYFVVSLEDVGAQSTMEMEIRSSIDNSIIVEDYTVTNGESLYLWFMAAPGQTYRALASWSWDEVDDYVFRADWFPAPDCYEPNNTRAEAKSIPVGETIEAYMHTGHVVSDVAEEDFDDWYRVHLDAGSVGIALRDVPAQASMQVELLDPQGAWLASEYGSEGEGLTLEADVPAGDYHVRVSRFYTGWTRGSGLQDIPDHFTRPYALTVTQ